VRIVRPRQGKADTGDEHELALPGLPLPGYAGLRFGLPAGRRLHREWRHSKPDLVHVVTEGPLGWSAVSAARRLGIPVTSGFHTNFDRYSLHYGLGWMRPAVAAYLRSLHRRTRATMVPTAALAADLAGEGLSGVRVVGRGVDAELFDPERRDPALRKRWGVADGAGLPVRRAPGAGEEPGTGRAQLCRHPGMAPAGAHGVGRRRAVGKTVGGRSS
jgi:hypothetical protein